MHRITREWLDQWRVPQGGWTQAQLDVLGVYWPPRAGWRIDLIGTEISDSDRSAFEHNRDVLRPRTLKRKAKWASRGANGSLS